MGSTELSRKQVVRPQLVVGLFALLCLASGGYLIFPEVVRPVQANSVPIIQPVALPRVQSAAIVPPVDCAKVACIALTFDDGPDTEVTPRVLDILERHNAKATFFLIGSRVAGRGELARRIHLDGHEIGNHTWSHHKLSDLSPEMIQQEVAKAQEAIAAAGVPAPRLFRPPYGAIDSMVRSHVAMTVVSWNIDPEDWKAKKPEQIVEHVLAHAKPGAIVDLHDTEHITADALEPILASLGPNYHFVTVSELLDLPAGQPGIFYGR
jgi:peptidoglycan/xylan/chitin deacetylase (PgdA/CDA1 family)